MPSASTTFNHISNDHKFTASDRYVPAVVFVVIRKWNKAPSTKTTFIRLIVTNVCLKHRRHDVCPKARPEPAYLVTAEIIDVEIMST